LVRRPAGARRQLAEPSSPIRAAVRHCDQRPLRCSAAASAVRFSTPTLENTLRR
jgi:hypothetical protein